MDIICRGPAPLSSKGLGYDYRKKHDGTLWNIGSAEEGEPIITWTINAWGHVFQENYTYEEFHRTFERFPWKPEVIGL